VKPKDYRPRERATGRYGFEGDYERLCVCGHKLGAHAAQAPHDCFNSDTGLKGATGETCECKRFGPRDALLR